MIVSHKHKFIFLKTQKTAGTSIEIALSKFCGPDDIITPITPVDEKKRSELGHRHSQNFRASIWDYDARDIYRTLRRRKMKRKFYNHMSAKEVKELIGNDIWDNYYKFCFERNPWDRVISEYYWRYSEDKIRPTICEFIHSSDLLLLKKRGYWLYTIDGQISVDKIYRFENLAGALDEIKKILKLPEKPVLPHAKSGFRKDKRSYRDILRQSEQAKIGEIFSDEIRLLGYEF